MLHQYKKMLPAYLASYSEALEHLHIFQHFWYTCSISKFYMQHFFVGEMLHVYQECCKKNKQHFHQTCSIFTQKMLRLRCDYAARPPNMVQEKQATFSPLTQHLPPKNAACEIWKCCKSTKNAARRTNNIFPKHAAYSPKKGFV